MEKNSEIKLPDFKHILQEHVHDLVHDQTESREHSNKCVETDIVEDESESDNSGLPVEPRVENDTVNIDCLLLCGRILRIMGDEVMCRACGKSLRNIGDEIFSSYATRNILNSLLKDLARNETVEENVR